MTHQRTNQVVAITVFFLMVGTVLAFALDQFWYGFGLFLIVMIIVLLKVVWSVAVWADNTLYRWTAKNLAPDDGVDITFRIDDEQKEDKNENKAN